MVNPSTYIRKGIIDAMIAIGSNVPVYSGLVPKSVNPIPKRYIVLTSQTLQPTAMSKECYEWNATINLDVNHVNAQGYSSNEELDLIVEQVLNAMQIISIPEFQAPKNRHRLVNMVDLPIETETNSIQRKVLTYSFWLKRI